MNENTILNKILLKVTPFMHKRRRTCLQACVSSLLNGAKATVTSMGRGLASNAYEKHTIKRADRLLSNIHLLHQLTPIYAEISQWMIANKQRPLILVDWSDIDAYKRHFLLRATLAFQGRSLTIYDEVHDIKTKEKPATHRDFLRQLNMCLPKNCRPIIVTDAGFKTPWFREVLALGWDFVGRTRLPNFYSTDNERWQCITTLYQQATTRPKSLQGYVARRNSLACRFVIIKQKKKGRQSINRSGQPTQSKKIKTHRKSANDPWLLTTSLRQRSTTAKKVVSIYRQRMQIEESFRDMKNTHYGFGLQANRVKTLSRLRVMILVTVLANLLTVLIGLMAQINGIAARYQVNSAKNKHVLSFPFLGRRVIKRGIKFTKQQWLETLDYFHQLIEQKTYEFL